MDDICGFFVKMDFIGPEYGFEEKESRKFQSIQGAIFSSMVFIAAFALSISFSTDLYKKSQPIVSTSQAYEVDSKIYLNNYPITLSFPLYGSYFVKEPLSYLDIDVHFVTFDANTNFKIWPSLSIEICDFSTFGTGEAIFNSTFTGNIHSRYCPIWDNSSYFENDYAVANSSFLQIEISSCGKIFPNRICPDDSVEYTKTLNEGFAVVTSVVDSIVDSSNYGSPVTNYVYHYVQAVGNGVVKFLYLTVSNDLYNSDRGWLINDVEPINYQTISSIRTDVLLSNSNSNTNNEYFILVFNSTKLRSKTDRTYLKIQDLFAKVGGISSAFMIVMRALTTNFLRFKYLVFVRSNFFLEKQLKDVANKSNIKINNFTNNIIDIQEKTLDPKINSTAFPNCDIKISQGSIQVLQPIKTLEEQNMNKNLYDDQTLELMDNEITYFSYLKSYLGCDSSKKAKFEFEFSRVKKLLNIKNFQYFLFGEYEKKFND